MYVYEIRHGDDGNRKGLNGEKMETNKNAYVQKIKPDYFSELFIDDCRIKLNFSAKPNENIIDNIKNVLLENAIQN